MKTMSIQEAYGRKFERQRQMANLEYHALGTCVHIGKISPGCIACFKVDPYRLNLNTGKECDLNCVYCSTRPAERNQATTVLKSIEQVKRQLLRHSREPDYSPLAYSFSGQGDPLANLPFINEVTRYIQKLTKYLDRKPWLYLYTNGVRADKETLSILRRLGFDEIRFHLGASNFSRKVLRHLEMAAGYLKVITVETPAWPPHRKQLFRMLPIFEDIGVKHLNIGEIEVNAFNFKRIQKELPDARIYPCLELHLYDEGLVYDIMERVSAEKYSYSVLDCSCFTKLIQRGRAKAGCARDLNNLTEP